MRRKPGASARMSDLTPHMDAGSRAPAGGVARAPATQASTAASGVGNALFSGGFLVAAMLVALLADADRPFSPVARRCCSSLALALVARIELWGDVGYGVPLQIVFVPMLLLLPTPLVPLLVAAGARARARGGQRSRGRAALGRSVLAVADAWFSARPRAGAGRARTPSCRGSSTGPPTCSRSRAQLLSDGAGGARAASGSCQRDPAAGDAARPADGLPRRRAAVPDRPARRAGRRRGPPSSLLVLPLAYLLLVFSREREARMRQSLELGRAYRGTALLLRDLLEEDDEYTGRHTEDVVGLTVSVAERMGLDEDTAPQGRARRAAARHRQDRRARRDHQQARPARTTRSGRS